MLVKIINKEKSINKTKLKLIFIVSWCSGTRTESLHAFRVTKLKLK